MPKVQSHSTAQKAVFMRLCLEHQADGTVDGGVVAEELEELPVGAVELNQCLLLLGGLPGL